MGRGSTFWSISGTPLPPEVVRLSNDCSVVFYYNSGDELRAAPSALCYPVLEPADPVIRRERRMTILDPDDRRPQIKRCVKQYLSSLEFGGTPIRLAENAERIPTRGFGIPDLRFGSNTILSVHGTPGAIATTMANLGRNRLRLLCDKSVGFFIQSPLQQQCFFYWFTVLAWTRPEDCTHYPINIKINDRRLFEDAATYDEHELLTHDEETKR